MGEDANLNFNKHSHSTSHQGALEELDECFKCAICLDTLKYPQMCVHCSGLFCKSCANATIASNSANTCPKCRGSWADEKLVKCRFLVEALKHLDRAIGREITDPGPEPPDVQSANEPSGSIIWKSYSTHDDSVLPENAVNAGLDSNGEPIYVCRVWYNRQLIIGKLNVAFKNAYIALDGREHEFGQCEVLCSTVLEWVDAPRTTAPWPRVMIAGGRTQTGQRLFIGRTLHYGNVHACGKVSVEEDDWLFVYSFGSKEFTSSEYEVLVHKTYL